MKFIYVLLSLVVLTSCATVDNSYKGSDAGYAVVNLAVDVESGLWDEQFDAIAIKYRKKGLSEEKFFYYSKYGLKSPGEYDDKSSRGKVILTPLPPGEYEIYNFQFYRGGYFNERYWGKADFSIPFEIRTKEFNYLGKYHGIAFFKKALLGKVRDGGYIILENTYERDLELAKVNNPTLNIANFKLSVPEVESINSPFFVKERTTKFDKN